MIDQDPQFGDSVIVKTQNNQPAPLYNAQGQRQNAFENPGSKLTVFEVKKINGRTFYRVGDQQSWLLKTDTNYYTAPTPQKMPEINERMSIGMRALIIGLVFIGLIVLTGIGYEVIAMNNRPTQSTMETQKSSLKERAASLTTKQLLALSLLYAERNDDSKLDSKWEHMNDVVSNNDYNIGRFHSYTFGDATVTAKGKNYIYVFEKGVGLGYQDKNGQRLVSFFTAETSDPMRVYDYQMLEDVNSMPKIKKLAQQITFTDEMEK